MRFLYFLAFSLQVLWIESRETIDDEARLLNEAIAALLKAVQFMEGEVANINLDGALGCQFVEIALDSFAKHRPEVVDGLGLRQTVENLSQRARRVVNTSKRYLRHTEPQYYAAIGRLLDMSEVLFWYPSRVTDSALVVEPPVPCSSATFNETRSDQCLIGIIGRPSDPRTCSVTKECITMATQSGQRGYYITHQAIYLQLAEMHNCTEKSELLEMAPASISDALCSNIMREATEIAEWKYPVTHQDLFMEQIGVCGFWGYRDFYKEEWLTQILEWQSDTGCYKNYAHWKCSDNTKEHEMRTKRQEKKLERGCLSHKTAVALFALATNIRFGMEKIYGSLK